MRWQRHEWALGVGIVHSKVSETMSSRVEAVRRELLARGVLEKEIAVLEDEDSPANSIRVGVALRVSGTAKDGVRAAVTEGMEFSAHVMSNRCLSRHSVAVRSSSRRLAKSASIPPRHPVDHDRLPSPWRVVVTGRDLIDVPPRCVGGVPEIRDAVMTSTRG